MNARSPGNHPHPAADANVPYHHDNETADHGRDRHPIVALHGCADGRMHGLYLDPDHDDAQPMNGGDGRLRVEGIRPVLVQPQAGRRGAHGQARQGPELLHVPEEEFEASGGLSLNVLPTRPRRCLAIDGFPRTKALMESAGCDVVTFDADELCLPCEGGPTCLTRPLLRQG